MSWESQGFCGGVSALASRHLALVSRLRALGSLLSTLGFRLGSLLWALGSGTWCLGSGKVVPRVWTRAMGMGHGCGLGDAMDRGMVGWGCALAMVGFSANCQGYMCSHSSPYLLTFVFGDPHSVPMGCAKLLLPGATLKILTCYDLMLIFL